VSIRYPLFAFEKDDSSICRIEQEIDILAHLEAIAIENDEYVIWDANGAGVSIQVSVESFKSKLIGVTSCTPPFPIHDAFHLCAEARKVSGFVPEGTPQEMWERFPKDFNRRWGRL